MLSGSIDTTGIDPTRLERAKTQARELEGVFLNMLVKEMFSGLDTESDFSGGFGEETWRSMQAEQLSLAMAEQGGIGLADHILRDLIAMPQPFDTPTGAAPSHATAISAYSGAR